MEVNRNVFPLKIYVFILNSLIISAFALNLINLPEKYYFDSNTILSIASGYISNYNDKSYGAIATVVRFLHLDNHQNLGKIFFLLLFLTLMQVFIMSDTVEKEKTISVLVLTFFILIGSVYFYMFTKEIIPLIINAIFLFAATKTTEKTMFWLITILIASYSVIFRSYWLITIFVFIFFEIVNQMFHNRRTKLLIYFCTFCLAVIVIGVYNPGNLASLQNELNQNRINSEFANSALINYPAFLPKILFWPYRLLSLFFPILLVQKIGIQSLLFSIFFIVSCYQLSTKYRLIGREDLAYSIIFRYLLSHFLVLSLFEPDYGSFVKHLTPFFIIFVFLLTRKELSVK